MACAHALVGDIATTPARTAIVGRVGGIFDDSNRDSAMLVFHGGPGRASGSSQVK